MQVLTLNRITDERARKAYIEHRRGNLLIHFSLFLVSKLIHLVYLLTIIWGDIGQYRAENENIRSNFPPNSDSRPVDAADEGLDAL